MKLSAKAEKILKQISDKNTKLGDLRTIAKDIKKDYELAMELWSTEHFFARQLAIEASVQHGFHRVDKTMA